MCEFKVEKLDVHENVLTYFGTLTPEGNFYEEQTQYLKQYEKEFLSSYKPIAYKIYDAAENTNSSIILPDHWLTLIYELSKEQVCVVSHDTFFPRDVGHWFGPNYKGHILKRKNRHAPVLVECTKDTLIGEDPVHMLWFPGVKGYVIDTKELDFIKKLARKKKISKAQVFEFLERVKFIFTASSDEREMILLTNKHINDDLNKLINNLKAI